MVAPTVWNGLPPVVPPDQPLLADAALQAELDDYGFIVRDLLDPQQVNDLVERHQALHGQPGHGFELDLASVSEAHKRNVHDALDPVWQGALAPLLVDPKFFMSSFAVKWPGEASRLPVHQDWSCVDERVHRSLVVWLALDDISTELGNGALSVLPGSHRFLAPPRGAMTIPWYWEYGEYIALHLTPLSLRAGEVAILDGRLIHASEPNRSPGPRRAAVTRVARSTAALQYTHYTDAGLEMYEVDPAFFIERGPLDLRARPPERHRIVERRSNEVPVVDPSNLASLCGADALPVPSGEPLTRYQLLGAPSPEPRPKAPEPLPPTGRVAGLVSSVRRRSRPATDATAPAWPIDGHAVASRIAEQLVLSDDTEDAWTTVPPPYEHRERALRSPTGDPALDDALATVPGTIVDAYLAVLPPGGRMRPPQGSDGWTGLLTVAAPTVRGAAALRIADRHVALGAGDSTVFASADDHEVWNLGGSPCVVLGWRSVPRGATRVSRRRVRDGAAARRG